MSDRSVDIVGVNVAGKLLQIDDGTLRLRPLRRADVTDVYVGWLNDRNIARYLEVRFQVHSTTDVSDFVESINASPNEFIYAMELVGIGRHIGNIKIGPIHPVHRCADISLFIGAPDCHGQGHGVRSLRLAQEIAFRYLGVRKLCAGVYAPNAASLAAFDRTGFRREGWRVGHYTLDGEPVDLVEFGLLAHEWPGWFGSDGLANFENRLDNAASK